ncbi:MAG: single-stranded DNA-binding protein [Arcanobacterium sp.]
MANDTYLSVRGWVAAQPVYYEEKVDETTGEVLMPAAAFVRIGVTPRYFNREKRIYIDGVTSWYAVRAYGQLGKNVSTCVTRGNPLLVRGRLMTRPYIDKDGNERSEQTIIADSIGIDLTTGIAQYRKTINGTLAPLPGEMHMRSAGQGDDVDASFEVDPDTDAAGAQDPADYVEDPDFVMASEVAEDDPSYDSTREDPAGVLAHV